MGDLRTGFIVWWGVSQVLVALTDDLSVELIASPRRPRPSC